jgi:hypothetical protein
MYDQVRDGKRGEEAVSVDRQYQMRCPIITQRARFRVRVWAPSRVLGIKAYAPTSPPWFFTPPFPPMPQRPPMNPPFLPRTVPKEHET